MPNLPALLVQFNRPFWVYHLIFTALGLFIIMGGGAIVLVLAIPLKLVGYAGAAGYQTYFSPREYFYYRNAGVAIRKLYIYSFMADMLLFLLLVAVYLKFIA